MKKLFSTHDEDPLGQNDESFNEKKFTNEKFKSFFFINKVHNLSYAVSGENEYMTGTFIMLDPDGKFFDITKGSYTYSKPILKIGINDAMKGVNIDYLKFLKRGGLSE